MFYLKIKAKNVVIYLITAFYKTFPVSPQGLEPWPQ